MEKQRRRGGMRLLKGAITAVFAVGFVFSLFSTFSAFAAANLFQIQNAELTEISATAEGSITSFDETNIVSSVTFHKLNDSAKYAVTLKNTDSKDHIIESITNDNENPYVTYEHDSYANTTVAAGANLDFVVTAKYTTAVTDTSARAQATNVKFIIKFTDIEEPEEIPIVPNTGENANPNTGDAIQSNVIMLVVFSAGLIICAIVYIKNHKKSAKVLGVAIALVAITAVATSVKAATTEVNSFTLTTNYGFFDKNIIKNGDDEIIINHCTKLGDIAEITNPTKTGYTFTGWQNQNGTAITNDTEICEDTELTPNFTANKYTVRFNRNGATGGEDMASQEFTYDQAQNLTKNTFKFPGRTYGGWDTEANGSGVHYDNEASVENLTAEDGAVIDLYAQWSINPYYIAYDKNGGEGEMAQTACEYDQDCTLRENAFTKNGYDFNGWKLGDATYADKAVVRNLAEEGTVTLVAQWQVHEYTITYTGLTDAEAAALRAAGNLDTYTIETPSFTLHNPGDRFDTDGDKTQHFEGWRESTVSAEITLPQTNSLSNKTYEAIWSNVATPEYTITYDYKDGNVATANKTKFTKFDTFTLNEPTKTGYTFTGWTGTDVATETKPYTVPTGIRYNLEFTAHYRKNTYTIIFAKGADDATGVTASIAAEYDTEYDLPASGFTRTGYTQNGWKNGEETIAADAKVKNLTAEDGATVTLAANWIPNTFTVIYHANNDAVSNPTAMNNQVVTYDETTTLTPNAYEYEHYKFMGWATSPTGNKVYDDEADITNLYSEDGATLNLYATWKERTAYLKGTVNNSWGSAGDMIRSLQGYSAATSFSHYEGEPNFDEIGTKYNMAISSSNFPVYTWIDGETIYWWSEAETIYAHEDSRNFFSGLKKAETIDYSGFNFSLTKNLAGFFRNTEALSTIDLSPLAAANPTTLEEMFYGSGIASVDLSPLNTTQTTNMKGMFNSTTVLETVNLSAINTANVTDMSYLFSNSTNLKSVDFSHNNLSSVEDMNHMFYGDKKLESLNFTGVNTPNLKKMSWMFSGAKIASLDLSDLDTGNVTHFDELFYYADVANLDISGFDTHNATMFGSMFTAFNAHGQVLDLSHFDTTSFNGSMYEMFQGTNASVIDLSSFDISAERAANIGMANILHISNNVETIYATEKLHLRDYSSVTDTNLGVPMDYGGQSKLVGGAGSTLKQLTLLGLSEYDKARIDDPCNGKPGMFAVKNAQYICYNANIPSGETGAGAQAGEYLTVGTNHLATKPITRQGYTLLGWSTTPGGEIVYADGAEIETEFSKDPIRLYAVWVEATSTLQTGGSVNVILKSINADATAFAHYAAGTPDFDAITDEQIISTDDSIVPTYAWNDNGTIYWWSETDKVYANESGDEMFRDLSSIESVDLEGLNFSNNVTLNRMFAFDSSLEEIKNINALNTPNVTSISHMFYDCSSLETLNLSGWDTSNIETVEHVFAGTTNLKILNLDEWDLTNFSSNLVLPTALTAISMKNVVAAEDMTNFFANQEVLTNIDLTGFDTSNTKIMAGMFNHCTNLESLNVSSFNTGNVTSMSGMFGYMQSLSELDVSNFNTSNVENMYGMFAHMDSLQELNVAGFNTEKVENMNRMFSFSYALTELDLSSFNTRSVTDMESMFHYSNVKTIYASENFDTANATSYANMFAGMSTGLKGGQGTQWSSSMQSNKDYARIDDPDNGNPGYFTYKNARYIRYHDNDGDDTNNEANYALMKSHYITTDSANPYDLATALAENKFEYSGHTFRGWATSAADAAAGTVTYADKAAVTEASKVPLELWAVWE